MKHKPATRVMCDVLPDEGYDSASLVELLQRQLTDDIDPDKNLASYSTTTMSPEANALIQSCLPYNLANQHHFRTIALLHQQCVSILNQLFHHPKKNAQTFGMATTGSSEAALLAGLAMKHKWQATRQLKQHSQPNIILSESAQIVWRKFARFFEVETRFIEINPDTHQINHHHVMEKIDSNTIGVALTLGCTLTGVFDPIYLINQALNELEAKTGLNIPIHVDAASGGFIAPFKFPDLLWDFTLNKVMTINVSGHKYGMVYPSVGWLLWRDEKSIPKSIALELQYLGFHQQSLGINFSQAAAPVVAQYFNFMTLGFRGYDNLANKLYQKQQQLINALSKFNVFDFIHYAEQLPIVVCRINQQQTFSAKEFSEQMSTLGWIIPAYPLKTSQEEIWVLRMVLKSSLTDQHLIRLLSDIENCLNSLIPTNS